MRKWVKQSPPLAGADYIHFSRRGAAYMGELFVNALRMHYDYFKFRDKHKIDDAKLKDIQKLKAEAAESAQPAEQVPAAEPAPQAEAAQ